MKKRTFHGLIVAVLLAIALALQSTPAAADPGVNEEDAPTPTAPSLSSFGVTWE